MPSTFPLIPLFQKQVADARKRELELVRQVFSSGLPVSQLKGLETYEFRSGTAVELRSPRPVRLWLDRIPAKSGGIPATLTLTGAIPNPEPTTAHGPISPRINDILARARLTLFIVLGVIYVLAV